MGWTNQHKCPNCASETLQWESVNWADGPGEEYRLGVVCKKCGAEVELAYELVEVELRVKPDGEVVA